MVSVGLAALVSLMTMSAMTMISNRQTVMQTKTNDYIDKTLAERIVLLDLRNVDPSFNVVKNVLDDKGSEFFEFFSDVSTKALNYSTRTLVLSLDKTKFPSARTEMYFLAADVRDGKIPLIMYEPSRAYEIGPEPADPMVSATLTYRGVNYQNWVSGQLGSDYWKESQLYLMQAEVSLRPVGSNELVIPSRSPAFVGMVVSDQLVEPAGINNRFETRMPWDLNQSLNSADLFLRTLPPSGGAVPNVRLMAVKLLRYSLEADPKGGARLYREVFKGSSFTDKFMITSELHWLQFDRTEVTSKAVSFAMSKIAREK